MQVPKLDKIVLNMGVGEADRRLQEGRRRPLPTWRDRRPEAVVTKARKSIAHFKLRETCRSAQGHAAQGDRMYEFLDRLVTSRCRACATSAA
jgi:large subunit ribosomal protein L5